MYIFVSVLISTQTGDGLIYF
uniref:Uncharacterized protein n=1 Tax=Anguilla anguilla TaxID=7936 RepID=A0A0E9Q562_ANGAN